MNSKDLLRILTTEKFRRSLENKLICLLAKHTHKDITSIEVITILEIFRIGLMEIERRGENA